MIPSCHPCNSGEKGDDLYELSTHINPYHRSFNETYKFKLRSEYLTNDIERNKAIELTPIDENDLTASAFKINDRYKISEAAFEKSNYAKALNLVNNYLDYYDNALEGDYEQERFRRTVLKDVPLESNLILNEVTGKLFRDVLEEIDQLKLINY